MIQKLLLPTILVAMFSVIAFAATGDAPIVPGGTDIAVTLQQPISSASASPGATYSATVSSVVRSLAGSTAIPAGSPALVELVSSPGTEAGTTLYTVMLKEITVNGHSFSVTAGWAILDAAADASSATEILIKGGAEERIQVLQGTSLNVPEGLTVHFILGEMLTLRTE